MNSQQAQNIDELLNYYWHIRRIRASEIDSDRSYNYQLDAKKLNNSFNMFIEKKQEVLDAIECLKDYITVFTKKDIIDNVGMVPKNYMFFRNLRAEIGNFGPWSLIEKRKKYVRNSILQKVFGLFIRNKVDYKQKIFEVDGEIDQYYNISSFLDSCKDIQKLLEQYVPVGNNLFILIPDNLRKHYDVDFKDTKFASDGNHLKGNYIQYTQWTYGYKYKKSETTPIKTVEETLNLKLPQLNSLANDVGGHIESRIRHKLVGSFFGYYVDYFLRSKLINNSITSYDVDVLFLEIPGATYKVKFSLDDSSTIIRDETEPNMMGQQIDNGEIHNITPSHYEAPDYGIHVHHLNRNPIKLITIDANVIFKVEYERVRFSTVDNYRACHRLTEKISTIKD